MAHKGGRITLAKIYRVKSPGRTRATGQQTVEPPETILILRLREALAATQAMLASGDLRKFTIRDLLQTLLPIILRQQRWLRQQAEETQSRADRQLAATLLAVLRYGAPGELSRSQISDLLWRNRTSRDISRALELLRRTGRAEMRVVVTPGKKGHPTQWWRATVTAENYATTIREEYRYPAPLPKAGKTIYRWGGVDRPADRNQPPAPVSRGRGPSWADGGAAYRARMSAGKGPRWDAGVRAPAGKEPRWDDAIPVRRGPVWR